MDRFLRLKEVADVTGLSRSQIYALVARGEFPRQRKLGKRSSGWRESEVTVWIEGCPPATAQRMCNRRGSAKPSTGPEA